MEASRFNNSCLERLKFYDTNSFEEKSVINENKEQNVIYNSKRNKNFSSINRTQQQQPSLLCLISNPTKRKTSTIASPLLKILSLIILYSFLNYDLNNILSKINRNHLSANGRVSESLSTIYKSNLPTIILAGKQSNKMSFNFCFLIIIILYAILFKCIIEFEKYTGVKQKHCYY